MIITVHTKKKTGEYRVLVTLESLVNGLKVDAQLQSVKLTKLHVVK